MNFSNDKKDVLFDYITEDWPETNIDLKYKRFLKQECQFPIEDKRNFVI